MVRSDSEAAALSAVLIEEEARRQEREAELDARDEPAAADATLQAGDPAAMPLGEVLRAGGFTTVAVLFGLNLVDEFDRAAFSILGPDIRESLGLSNLALGLIGTIGTVFVVLGAVPLGQLADRSRRTRLVTACSLVWSGVALATAFVTTAPQLLFCRVFGGVGKATDNAVQKPILADAYPIEGRSRVFAVHNMANPVGDIIGPIVVGVVAGTVGGANGWRWAFVVLAVPALVLAAVSFAVPEPRRGRNEQRVVLGSEFTLPERVTRVRLSASFARLRRIRTYSAFLASLGALGFFAGALPVYLNIVLEEHYGVGAAGRGLIAALGAMGAAVGVFLGGRYGDRLFHRDPRLALTFVAGAIAFLGISVALAVNMPNVPLYTFFTIIRHTLVAAAAIPALAVLSSIVPFRMRSTGLAMVGIYPAVVGGFGGVLVLGSLSDALGPRPAISIVVPLAAAVGGLLLLRGRSSIHADLARVALELEDERDRMAKQEAGARTPLLEVSRLDVSYGPLQILFDVSLEVEQGEVLALLGTNGAGKSTLLRAISGLTPSDRGTMLLDGHDITLADARARVEAGIVQIRGGKGVFPGISVRENLLAAAYTYIWDDALVAARMDEVLAQFPALANRLEQRAGSLSGGEQQMLAVAKALMLRPRLLLIDELSLGLAPVVVQGLVEVVEQLKAEGLTIVVVEQSLNVAALLADRAVFLERGRIRFEGRPAELLERGDLARAVFLGGEGG